MEYSGGLNRKGREHVFVLDANITGETTCTVKASKRLYPHEVPKEAEGYAWAANLTLAYTIRIPKEVEESDSEDDSDGANALLGGDSSDSDSDSSSSSS